jgi:hypothetical protein
MKANETRQEITPERMAAAKEERETEKQMQGIANAFFFGVAIFSVTFACFILSLRAQDQHYRPEHAQLDKLLYRLVPPPETSFVSWALARHQPVSHSQER